MGSFLAARVGWEELNYTISESDVFGQACVTVSNPPNDIPLAFDIHLHYQSVTGTAAGKPHLIIKLPCILAACIDSMLSQCCRMV